MPRLRAWAPLALAAAAGCLNPQTFQGEPRLRVLLEGAFPGAEVSELRPGMALAKRLSEGPLALHVLAIDIRRKDLALRPILAGDRLEGGPEVRETLSAMARRTGALALIPGDYPGTLLQVTGLTVIDGKVDFAPPKPARSALLLGRDGKVWMGLFSPDKDAGLDYFQALSGGPALMKDGRFQFLADGAGKVNGEAFAGSAAEWNTRRGWTVVGVSRDRHNLFWIVAASGPSWYSLGAGPEDLGKALAALGCAEAVGYLGGTAAELYADGRAVNVPPGGTFDETPLGSAWGVFAAAPR